MRFALSLMILLFHLTLSVGQDKIPKKITRSVYSVKKAGTDMDIDSLRFSYNRFFDNEGNDITSEHYGFIREPDLLKRDERGNVIERSRFNRGGSLLYRVLYRYDHRDRVIETRSVDEQSNVIMIDETEYDEAGNKIRTEKFDADSSSILKTIYRYDTVKNQVMYTEYKRGRLDRRYTHTYDDNDNLIEKQWLDSLGNYYSKTIFDYTDKNEQLRETTYDSGGHITHKKVFDYVFNQYGNWTERWEYIDDRLKEVVKREISYYE